MSISNRSNHHSALRLAKRHRVAGLVAGLAVAFSIFWGTMVRPSFPELRVVDSGNSLSVEIVDGPHVILITNASSPTRARAALGTFNRPWEPKPNVVISDSRDNVAGGLWETLQRAEPEQLIVLGAPGDSADWARIERYCRDRGIDVRYLDQPVTLELDALSLTLLPGPNTGRGFQNSHLLVANGDVHIAVELGGLPSTGRFHVIVAGDELPVGVSTDLEVVPSGRPDPSERDRRLLVEQGRRVVLVLEPDRIRVRGGSLETATDR